ncbi:MAG TPA: spore germination protein [Firmicutes bacterium]|nr:spore germination protein [Bacillota bacterium]
MFHRFFHGPRRSLPLYKRHAIHLEEKEFTESLEENLKDLKKALGDPADLVWRRLEDGKETAAVVLYFETLVDSDLLGRQVIEPLNRRLQETKEPLDAGSLIKALTFPKVLTITHLHQAVERLLTGDVLLLPAGARIILSLPLLGVPRRQVEEAPTEKGIKGPREGFTETITDNIGLIRRYIKDPNLRLEKMIIGERTKTEVALVYLNDLANPDVVAEARKRLEQIEIDGILESNYLAELISDRRWTIFPLVQETERPDKVAAAILEGRVVIFVDRSPFTIIVPVTSNELYQSQVDFYYNPFVATMLRLTRALGTIIAVTLPGLYLSFISVNPELFPRMFIQLEASSRIQVPLPAALEMLITFFAFEVLRESSIRFPAGLNLIIGVGGGIVMGLAAINAGLVSGITVAVVVFCILGTFNTSNPAKEQAWRWVRYLLFAAGAAFGFMGVVATGILVLAHMAGLKSFGVSYLAPWAPPLPVDMADAPVRLPWWSSYRRPPTYRPREEDRLGETEGEK